MSGSNKDLNVTIIGAGMGGLCCALSLAKRGFTKIDVYETASNLGFVGAGIQLAPNMARILDRLGCWAEIESEAVDLKETSIRQGETDAELGHVDLRYIRETYGYPHMVSHRSSLAGALFNGCKKEKAITFFFSTSAGTVSSFTPKPKFIAQPRDGDPYTVTTDVLLAADGIKSAIRPQILAELNIAATVQDTGQAAYRIMLPRSSLAHDPELLSLLDDTAVTRWIAPSRHIIAYPVSAHSIYNISTSQPDANFAAAPSATYTTRASKAALLSTFGDYCPRIQKMLELVPEGDVCEWKLRVHAPLPTWIHGSVALVGDACHPTLPHLAQGAAQAIEDAAVLAVVLERLPSGSDAAGINRALRVYERLRKARAEALVEMAAVSGRGLHLGEGEAREERDRVFRALAEVKAGAKGVVPDKWADAEVQRMVCGHDCVRVAEEEFEQLWEEVGKV